MTWLNSQWNETSRSVFVRPACFVGNLQFLSFFSFLPSVQQNLTFCFVCRSSLMTAASEGHVAIVRLFLQHKANTELKDSQGWKASDHAVIHGHHRQAKHTGIPISCNAVQLLIFNARWRFLFKNYFVWCIDISPIHIHSGYFLLVRVKVCTVDSKGVQETLL